MKILLRQAFIINPVSIHHQQRKDILVTNGTITQINTHIATDADIVIEDKNLHISGGWVDIFSFFGQPGYEYRETLETGASAAAAGGFTDVMLIPNTAPTTSGHAQVSYLKQQASLLPVNLHPIGSITNKTEGKELTEMYDMHQAGALAFSDGLNPVQQTGVLLKALQYVKAIDGIIIQVPDDKGIAPGGLMNESITSTRLGLPGRPAIAEEILLSRDIDLLTYTGSRLHVTGISTRKSLQMVKQAKKQGLDITCSVTPYHCIFCDEDLNDYNTYLKVNPPLRSRQDMMALRKAVADGEIDCIASHHMPLHPDEKICEFEYAKNGMSSLESVFAATNSFVNDAETMVEILCNNPRKIFGLPVPVVEVGKEACLTIFNPDEEYVFTTEHIHSKSLNNAFIGSTVKGKIFGTICRNKIHQTKHV